MNGDGYVIECAATHARLAGIMRLASPDSYEQVLQPVRAAMQTAEHAFRLDIADVRFMNSSGITALSRLVLLARQLGRGLQIRGSRSTPWQAKTLSSLQRLYEGLEVELD